MISSLEVTTIWDRPVMNEDSKFKAYDEKPNQYCKRWRRILWSIVSKQQKGLGEVQWNDQHQSKQKYHFGYVGEQFHKNEICDMLTEILIWDYEHRDAIKDDQQWHVRLA